MIIQYYGKGYVKISLGDEVISCNPPGKDSDLSGVRFGAQVVLSSAPHPDYNGIHLASFGEKTPFVVDGPGEYEVGSIFIKGFASSGPDGLPNTIYSILFDEINICHLGALSKPEITAEVKGALGDIDILFVPTYDNGVLEPSAAHKLQTALDPRVVIPLYYGGPKQDYLKQFLKELGSSASETVDKYVVKRKDLESKEGDCVVVQSF